jgi:curved DNA-binding protein CbpA
MLLYKEMENLNHYKCLGIKSNATLQEIRSQFKKLILIYHPDKGGEIHKFNQIKQAYSHLYHFKKQQQKQHKRENISIDEYMLSRNKIKTKSFSNLSMKDFHKTYENTRMSNSYDKGRQDFLSNDTTTDKNKLQIQIVRNPASFNSSFASNARSTVNKSDDICDFSTYVHKQTNKQNIACADLQLVYQKKPILENNMGNTRINMYLSNNKIDTQRQYLSNRNRHYFV